MSASSGRCQPTMPGPETPGVFASTVDIARPARRLNCSSVFVHSTPRKRLMPAPSDGGCSVGHCLHTMRGKIAFPFTRSGEELSIAGVLGDGVEVGGEGCIGFAPPGG